MSAYDGLFPQRHVAYVTSDVISYLRGGSTRIAVCHCGWNGPQRATLEVASDDALEHEREYRSP